MRKLGVIFLLSALAASAADVYNFGSIPPGGSIAGAPGSTVGWGYSLQNESTSLWLVPTDLSAGNFSDATPSLLFDFPILAPARSVAVSFDPANMRGLYELTWSSSAPMGFSNTGTFAVDAQWWSGDPLAGGIFVSGAPAMSVPYNATVSVSGVPEPGTLAITGLVLLALALTRGRIQGIAAWRKRWWRRAPAAVLALCAATLTCAMQAHATTFNWSYADDGHHGGSGTLTTTGATSPYAITSITGTFDNAAIFNLLPTGNCCGAPGNDNLLYSAPSTQLDGNGMAFETAGEPGFYDILFFNGAYSVLDVNGIMTFGGTFVATETIGSQPGSSVPEPAALGIVAAGLSFVGALFARRRNS